MAWTPRSSPIFSLTAYLFAPFFFYLLLLPKSYIVKVPILSTVVHNTIVNKVPECSTISFENSAAQLPVNFDFQ